MTDAPTEVPRRILVTGGARGIGRATALMAAARGWPVAIGYRARHDQAQATLEAVRALGVPAVAVAGDVADPAAVADLFARAADALGGLDAVVVNAGIAAPLMRLADMDDARLDRMVRVNLLGALHVARAAARVLPRASGPTAALTFLSSVAARTGSPGDFVDYAATKGALDTLTLGLARELAPDRIRVNAVRPGLIDTEMQADSGMPDRAHRLAPMIPLGRPGTADEIAEAVIWLSSEAARYVSGAILDVSGGR